MSTINGSSGSTSSAAGSKQLDKLVAQQFLNALNLNKAAKDNTATFQELDDARKQEVKSETKHAEQQTQTIKNPVLNKSIVRSPAANLTKDAFTPLQNEQAPNLTLAQGKNLVETVQKSLQLLSAMSFGEDNISADSLNKSTTIPPNKLYANNKSTKTGVADSENPEEPKDSPKLKNAKNAAAPEELEGSFNLKGSVGSNDLESGAFAPNSNTQEYDPDLYSSLRNNFSASGASAGFGNNTNGAICALIAAYVGLIQSSTQVQLQTANTMIETNGANLSYLKGSLDTMNTYVQSAWTQSNQAADFSRAAAGMKMFEIGQGLSQALGGMATQVGASRNQEMLGNSALETMSNHLNSGIKPVTSEIFDVKAPNGTVVDAFGGPNSLALKANGPIVNAAGIEVGKYAQGSYIVPDEFRQPSVDGVINSNLVPGHDLNVVAQKVQSDSERRNTVDSTDIYVTTVKGGILSKASVQAVKDQTSFGDFGNPGKLRDPGDSTKIPPIASSELSAVGGNVNPLALDRTLRANGFSSSNDASGVRNIYGVGANSGKVIEIQTIIRVVGKTDAVTKQATVTYWASSKKVNPDGTMGESLGASKLLSLTVNGTKADQMRAGTASDFSRNHARYEEFDTSNNEFNGSKLQDQLDEINAINKAKFVGTDIDLGAAPMKVDFSLDEIHCAAELAEHTYKVGLSVATLESTDPRTPVQEQDLVARRDYRTKLQKAYDLSISLKRAKSEGIGTGGTGDLHIATTQAQKAIHDFIQGTPVDADDLTQGRVNDGIKDSDDFTKFQNLAANSEGTKELFHGLAPHSQKIAAEAQRISNQRHRAFMGMAGGAGISSGVFASLEGNQTAQSQTAGAEGARLNAIHGQIQTQTQAITQQQQNSEGSLSQAQQTAGAVAATASSAFAQSAASSATK